MRYLPEDAAQLRVCLEGQPDDRKVEADPDTGINAETVKDLRALEMWPPGLVVDTPRENYPELTVGSGQNRLRCDLARAAAFLLRRRGGKLGASLEHAVRDVSPQRGERGHDALGRVTWSRPDASWCRIGACPASRQLPASPRHVQLRSPRARSGLPSPRPHSRSKSPRSPHPSPIQLRSPRARSCSAAGSVAAMGRCRSW
jgi:hypothetical protein